jgi:hypothetical protein
MSAVAGGPTTALTGPALTGPALTGPALTGPALTSPALTGIGLAGAVLAGAVLVLASCGSTTTTAPSASGVSGSDLRSYVSSVERVRLPVNRLLDEADPILEADHEHRISPVEAGRRFSALEERFAAYAVSINALRPPDATLRRLNAAYAHTYLLEDNYLSALAAALPGAEFDGLPHTQNAQRLAIIEWRTRLQELADALGVRLPSDIQQAGRGEIAPSPSGS